MSNPLERFNQVWKNVYSTPDGREAIGLLFEQLDIYKEIDGDSAMQIGIAIGRRNVAARLAHAIGRKPQELVADVTDDNSYVERMLQTKTGDF